MLKIDYAFLFETYTFHFLRLLASAKMTAVGKVVGHPDSNILEERNVYTKPENSSFLLMRTLLALVF